MLIPQLRNIEFNMYQEEISESLPIAIMVKEIPAQVAVTVEEVSASVEWSDILADVLWGVYIIGLAFFGFRLLRSLYRIYRLHMDGRKEVIDGASIIYTQSEHLPFSFWNTVYISDQVELTEEFQDILEHERTHVKSRHSIDVLLLELIQIAFWFNPMIYLYKTALRQTHEYLADAAVLRHTSRKTYGTMLLKQSLSGLEIALTHQFFHSHIKKRINMMYQKKSGRSAWLKYALALPVLFVLTVVFANRSVDAGDNLSSFSEIHSSANEQNNRDFDKEALKAKISEIARANSGNKEAMAEGLELLVKDYFKQYPDDQSEIMIAVISWGFEEGYSIRPTSQTRTKDGAVFHTYSFNDLKSLKFVVQKRNKHPLHRLKGDEDHSVITKQNIKELLDLLYTRKFDHPEALSDFINFSYNHRSNPSNIEILIQRYKEVLTEEKLDVYDDFEKVQVSVGTILPKELLSIKDIDLDDPSLPVIWTQEGILSQSINEFVDVSKPIDAIYYLPPSEAVKIFGEKGSKGFYALMGYERPLSHPQKQRELLEFEMDNFFSTLANDINEKAWAEKLKEIHKKMQDRYPKVGDWITPFTTKAHKYNINLVIKNKEIIAAYRDGVERIDEDSKDVSIDFIGFNSASNESNFVSTDTDSILDDLKALHRSSEINSFYRIGDFTNEVDLKGSINKKDLIVSVEGEMLIEGVDYTIDEKTGRLKIINRTYNKAGKQIHVKYNEESSHEALQNISNRSSATDRVYKVVDEMPRFPGCELLEGTEKSKRECADEKLIKYINKNLKYPREAKINKIEGRVYVQFIIEKDGTVSNTKILRDIGAGCGAEALRIVDKMNQLYERWIPGMEKGETVRVQYTMPFTFKLEDPNNLPLYIIDGTIVDEITFDDYFEAEEIQEFSSLSVADATKKYGEEGKNGAYEIVSKKNGDIQNILSQSEKNIYKIASREPELKDYITYATARLNLAKSQKEYKVDLYDYYTGDSPREALEYFVSDIDSDLIDAEQVTEDGYFIFNLKENNNETSLIEIIYVDKQGYDRYINQKRKKLNQPIKEKVDEATDSYGSESKVEETSIQKNNEGFNGITYLIDGIISTQEDYDKLDKESISSTRSFDNLKITDATGTQELREVIEVITKHDSNSKNNAAHIIPSWWENKIESENDTIIIFDPETFTEKIIMRPQLDADFSIKLTYEKEIVTLSSQDAYWTTLTFNLLDGESQVVDYNGLADSRNHKAQFSFEIVKDGNQFTFKNNHGFDWVEMQTNCKKWIYSYTEITKSDVEINCF